MTKINKNNESVNMSETKVMCPVCGTEFAIGEHEHKVKNGIAIGKDSGLGDVYLPVSKRGDALKAAGIDTSKYFAIQLPTGGEQLMRMDESGRAVPVSQDDPILAAIAGQGTVPNRNLFRRWVMSQMFHALQMSGGISQWMKWRGYDYSWKMTVEELRVQAKLYDRDRENFRARNRWFNQEVAVAMARDYIDQVRHDCAEHPTHKCKGVDYIKFNYMNVFVADIEKKIIAPLESLLWNIKQANTPQKLYEAVQKFWHNMCPGRSCYKQCAAWKDAFKGAGAYFTMQNMLRFHGAHFPQDNQFYNRRLGDLQMLEAAAEEYQDGDGWRLIGLMKQMISECGIDIDKKMQEWARAKSRREAARK